VTKLGKAKRSWDFGERYRVLVVVEAGSHLVAKAGLELVILLAPPPLCWDFRCVLPCPDEV
jgi:hypothetical protein